jgi:hypothetical protein
MSSISLKTHKMLWGRSGNMCAFPDCKQILVADETATDDPFVVGEEAHIVARKKKGPRGNDPLPMEKRDFYDNLILMCSIHHKIIDDQENSYPVSTLKEYKSNHEQWVKENLSFDSKKQKEDELYVTYIQKFSEYTNLDNWNAWTSWLIGSGNVFPKDEFESLKKLPDYIVSLVWPGRYPKLEMALINFKNVLNDLMKVFHEHIQERGDGYQTEKFYKQYNESGDHELINKMVDRYNYHICLIMDLTTELTRALNYICDFVREYIFEGFRLEEGVVLITNADLLSSQTYRVEYRDGQRIDYPYKGLRVFMEERKDRDIHFGEGVDESYFRKMPWEE